MRFIAKSCLLTSAVLLVTLSIAAAAHAVPREKTIASWSEPDLGDVVVRAEGVRKGQDEVKPFLG